MKMNDNSLSAGYVSYLNSISGLTYWAMSHNSDVVLKGLSSQRYGYSNSISFYTREALDSMGRDLFIRGRVKRDLLLCQSSDNGVSFAIAKEGAGRAYSSKPLVVDRLRMTCADIGIRSSSVRRLVRKLKRAKIELSPKDPEGYLYREGIGREMADRAGSFMLWTLSGNATFTDAFILLRQCERTILAIKFCRRIEEQINAFFVSSGFADASISIPTYPLEQYESARDAFIQGEISEKEFSDTVFHYK